MTPLFTWILWIKFKAKDLYTQFLVSHYCASLLCLQAKPVKSAYAENVTQLRQPALYFNAYEILKSANTKYYFWNIRSSASKVFFQIKISSSQHYKNDLLFPKQLLI